MSVNFNYLKRFDGFIGFTNGGDLQKLIALQLVKNGTIKFSKIIVYCRNDNLEFWRGNGCLIVKNYSEVAKQSDIIFLSIIMPDRLMEVITTFSMSIKNKLFIAMMEGVSLQDLEAAISVFENCRVIKTMPIVLQCAQVCTLVCKNANTRPQDLKVVKKIMGVLGICRDIPEPFVKPISSLALTKPTIVLNLLSALPEKTRSNHRMNSLTSQAMMVAARNILASKKHLRLLKKLVASESAKQCIHAMQQSGLINSLRESMENVARVTSQNENMHQSQYNSSD